MTLKKIALVLWFCCLPVLMAGCGNRSDIKAEKTSAGGAGGKISVYTTLYPLYDFASQVGGDRVEVVNLLPPGAEPHHWEPGSKEMVALEKTDVFVYCGAGLEPWVERVLKNTGGNKVVVDASQGVNLLKLSESEEHDDVKEQGQGQDGHGAGAIDPHIWLDPQNAVVMVNAIFDALVEADPGGREYYSSNAAAYKGELARLDSDYKATLEGAATKKIVVSHAAFGYLAHRYGLEQIAVRGLTADAEPTPAKMVEIVNLVRKNNIKYIFYESMVDPGVSQTIARESGAGTLVLNPLAGLTSEEIAAGKNYITVMRENLANIKLACQAR